MVEFHARIESRLAVFLMTSLTQSRDIARPATVRPAEVRVVVVVVEEGLVHPAAVLVVTTEDSTVTRAPPETRHYDLCKYGKMFNTWV